MQSDSERKRMAYIKSKVYRKAGDSDWSRLPPHPNYQGKVETRHFNFQQNPKAVEKYFNARKNNPRAYDYNFDWQLAYDRLDFIISNIIEEPDKSTQDWNNIMLKYFRDNY